MKCTECGNVVIKSVGDHVYRESGMDHVILRNITKYSCESCGAQRIQLVAMGQLHHAIAMAIAAKPARLLPSEVRFLRDHLELSNNEFAATMGVTSAQASRWTSTDPIGVPAERFLRALVAAGPQLARAEPADDPGLESLLADAVRLKEVVSAIAHVMRNLPPASAEVEKREITLRRSRNNSGESWTQIEPAN